MTGPRDQEIFKGALMALASAMLFAFTTPAIGQFGRGLGPFETAALLYGGASAGALLLRAFSQRSGNALTLSSLPRLLTISLLGAALAPSLLAWGIGRAGATASSLVLNLEAIATVLFAWFFFRETIGRRVILALLVMLVGGVFVALDIGKTSSPSLFGVLAVAVATVAWGGDNALTRGLAENDPLEIVAAKGGLGAAATGLLAFSTGEVTPSLFQLVTLVLCGAMGYGFSLRLYLMAQRRIGAARTSSVFAVGPFLGAAIAWLIGDRNAGVGTAIGAVAFIAGVWLHLTEKHRHGHIHQFVEHEHAHTHGDGHHNHAHIPPVEGEHTHWHRHEPQEHEHSHAPDLHHGHVHS